jgi:hypothetical protein
MILGDLLSYSLAYPIDFVLSVKRFFDNFILEHVGCDDDHSVRCLGEWRACGGP